jgi:hypothetical protein
MQRGAMGHGVKSQKGYGAAITGVGHIRGGRAEI